ncbi:MAG: glycosyltransferase family 2 protein [Acidithiobacillus sp.]|nr:glycosyltransferase family 2 protein [Acidithiobacillus sp.]
MRNEGHKFAGRAVRAPEIAVLIPCYNESLTIGKVVEDFRRALPEAAIYVYDNNSQDDTAAKAADSGAMVRREDMQGKGNVVRRMFRDIEADFYILVDGDDTYDAGIAPQMLRLALEEPCDLVNCIRRETEQEAYRVGHRFGNLMLTGMVGYIFGNRVQDMLSGYKVLSRRFVKSFPALSGGFDIETELTVHALELSMPVAHVEGSYRGRPEGSESKLHTYRDGLRILWLISILFKHERPLQFFWWIGLVLMLISLALGIPVVLQFLQTGLVMRLPTAVLAMGIMLVAFLSIMTGLILDTVSRGRREAKMFAYLQYSAYPSPLEPNGHTAGSTDEPAS